jgi:hypothetical protein
MRRSRDDLLFAVAVIAERIMRQRRAEARQHAVVIDDQAEILARIDAVRPRDGLHQRMRLAPEPLLLRPASSQSCSQHSSTAALS